MSPNSLFLRMYGFVASFVRDEAANIESGVLAIIGIVVAVLVFSAVAPSIASGLNNTQAAFSGFPGVSGIISVLPIVLVVGVLLFLFLGSE